VAVVVTCADRDGVAATVAMQLGTAISRLQTDPDRIVQVCLTGGRIANEVYRQLADASDVNTVEWGRVEFWWGDERFVPVESPDRNAGQNLALLAATIPFDPALVHPMPARGSAEADLRQAALHYASELGDTVFDICLLGMGEDGHVASIFPDHPSFEKETASTVVGVTNSPKPPAERLSLTLPVLNRSSEVWLIVAGPEKAAAVARSIAGDSRLPAGSVQGTERTVWFLDHAAAPPLG
jgi:6-phosphogluconolactonase